MAIQPHFCALPHRLFLSDPWTAPWYTMRAGVRTQLKVLTTWSYLFGNMRGSANDDTGADPQCERTLCRGTHTDTHTTHNTHTTPPRPNSNTQHPHNTQHHHDQTPTPTPTQNTTHHNNTQHPHNTQHHHDQTPTPTQNTTHHTHHTTHQTTDRSCVDRDRLVFGLRASTMVGHFLDELLPVDQAVVVKGITDKAGMVKPIDLLLSSPRMRQLLMGILLPLPGPRSGTGRSLGRCLAVVCFCHARTRLKLRSQPAHGS